MKILFLGTSGAGITKIRNLPSILIDRTILFDCGEGTLKSLYENNIELSDIKCILITHFHADHILGLVSFIFKWAFYDNFPESPNIYIPEGMKSNLMKILKATSTLAGLERVGFTLNVQELPLNHDNPLHLELDSNKEYEIDWIKSIHDPICYAYKINDELVYTGDTAYSKNIEKFSKDVKLLIHESALWNKDKVLAKRVNHTVPNEVAELAKNANVKRVILTHIPDISEKDLDHYLKDAKEIFKNLGIARDNLKIEI